jgi:chemotaxis protein MotB
MAVRKQEEEPQNVNRWMITYTDLCILLLSFFVLLISMSMVDQKRERAVLNSLVGSFGIQPGGRSPLVAELGKDPSEAEPPMRKNPTVDLQSLTQMRSAAGLDAEIHLFKESDKVTVRISHRDIFRGGNFEFQPRILPYLSAVAAHLVKSGENIEIRGHSDPYEDVAAADWSQRSWASSVKRARTVYDYFRGQGIAGERMSAHGFSYYQPLIDGSEFPQFRFKNMRIEILLGKNENRPASLLQRPPTPSHFFNYKNFFFRLYPVSDKPASSLVGPGDGTKP